jgi:hypothetical protein
MRVEGDDTAVDLAGPLDQRGVLCTYGQRKAEDQERKQTFHSAVMKAR